jgi:hypothetical protein
MSTPVWRDGAVALWDLGPGGVLAWPGGLLAIDPDDGFARVFANSELAGPLTAVLFTGPGPERIGGLFSLLADQARRPRTRPLTLVHGLIDDGVPALAAAYRQVDPASGALSLEVEPLFDGDGFDLVGGGLSGHDVGGLLFRLTLGGTVVVLAGGAAPSTRVARLVGDAAVAWLEGEGHTLPHACVRVGR